MGAGILEKRHEATLVAQPHAYRAPNVILDRPQLLAQRHTVDSHGLFLIREHNINGST